MDRPLPVSDVIDVNLGNSPEAFVRAAYGQVTGREPSPEQVATWTTRLEDAYVMGKAAGR